MRRPLARLLALAAALACVTTAAHATDAPEPREVPVRAAFVVRGGEPRPLDTEPPHPGEVVGLRLDWPEGPREAVELVAPDAQVGQVVPLRLVAQDPRAEGADVLEVLVLGLGEVEVPGILLRSSENGVTFTTAAVTLEVKPALSESETDPAPARDQAGIGLNPLGVALWVALLLVAAAVAVVVIRRRRRRAPAAPRFVAPEIPPDVWAHKALDQLLASSLLAEGRIKEFHIRLAAISKEYLSRRFRIHLMERTSAECPEDLRAAGVDGSLCEQVREWLAEIDLVKFAGERPAKGEVEASTHALRTMIEITRPRTAPVAAAQAGSAA